MKKLLLCLAAAACLGLTAGARDDADAERLGWKLGAQAYTFRALSFFETLEKLQALGIKYVEAYPGQKLKPGSDVKVDTGMSAAESAEMQAKLKATGVKLVAFGVAGIPGKTEAELRKHFEWAKKLGIEVLVTETVPTPAMDKLSQEFGIKLALHNHPKSWPAEQVLAATKDLRQNCGSCADTGHWKRAGRVPLEELKKLEGRIVELHFKDVVPTANKKGWEDAPWGTGEGDAKALLAELKRQGFKGYFQIEYERGTVDELMQNLPKCAAFFDKTAAELAK
jgi:sugar phosphate isomerase/epimerase